MPPSSIGFIKDIKIALYRFSAAPSKGTAAKGGIVQRSKGGGVQPFYAVVKEKGDGCINGAVLDGAVGVGTDLLADITAPGGVVLFQESHFVCRQLSLFLGDGGKALAPLAS